MLGIDSNSININQSESYHIHTRMNREKKKRKKRKCRIRTYLTTGGDNQHGWILRRIKKKQKNVRSIDIYLFFKNTDIQTCVAAQWREYDYPDAVCRVNLDHNVLMILFGFVFFFWIFISVCLNLFRSLSIPIESNRIESI